MADFVRSKKQSLAVKACIPALFLGLLLNACATAPDRAQLSPALPNVTISPEQPTAAQGEKDRILASYSGHYENPALQAAAEKIVARLVAASERPDLKYQITLLNSPAINAFSLPDGQLYVTRGLIALTNNEDELASVLAHEMGHVIARHAAIREEQARQTAIINSVVNDVLSDPDAGALALAKSKLTLANFSRAQEYEADELGIRIAAHAGYSPFGASHFLVTMQRDADLKTPASDFNKSMSDFLSNHPATPERIKNALETARQLSGSDTGKHDRTAYLNDLDGVLYGDDLNQGYVRGRHFVHPKLGFAFTAPTRFALSNTAQSVSGHSDDGSEAMRLDVVNMTAEQSLTDYLKSGWIDNIEQESVEELMVNGFPAATAIAKSEQRFFRLYVLQFDHDLYRFVFSAKNYSAEVDRSFQESIMSFRRMTQAESKQVKPLRLKIISVRAGDTPKKLARRMAIADYPLETFRVLNGLDAHDRLKPGQHVKIVVN
jgi:predicted Zn-dependent protease